MIQPLIEIHNIIDLFQFLLTYLILVLLINVKSLGFLAIWNITIELPDLPLMRNRQILHIIEVRIAFTRNFPLRVIRNLGLVSVIINVKLLNHNLIFLILLGSRDFHYLVKFRCVLGEAFTIRIVARSLDFSVQILCIKIKILIFYYRARVEL